jgi:hypothetical protein
MERSIDELLSDEPAEPTTEAAPQEATEPTPEPEAQAEDRPRDPETGQFLPKQTGVEEGQAQPVAEAVPPAADQLPAHEFAALKDERRKRQALEQQIADLNARFVASQQRPVQPEAPVDFWDNPQGVIATQVQQAVTQALQAEKQQQTMARINESEVKAKATYADYDDAFRAFQQAATANHSLIQQMTAASDPAEFAYKKGKTALDLERVGSIDELLANAKAQWEQEARAAMPVPTAALPSTTATDGSVGGRTGPAWAGPVPLDQLLG